MWEKKGQPTFFTEQFDHLVGEKDKFRLIKESVDFSFVNELARPYYHQMGASGYAPDKLYRCLLVMYLENIRSERELEEHLRFNIRYRYFCDLDIADPIPDHSTFSVFRTRLGAEAFCEIFDRLVEAVLDFGVATPTHFSVDSTSVLADCAHSRAGKKSDTDAAYGPRAGGKQIFFGYKAHNLIDSESEIVIETEATPGNMKDIPSARRLLAKVASRHGISPEHLAADKAYSAIAFRRELKEQDIVPVIPQQKGGTKGGFLKEMFNFNSDGDLICPAGRKMKAQCRYGDGRVEYTGNGCNTCEFKSKCTKASRRRVTLSMYESEKRIYEQFQMTAEFQKLYVKRNAVERVAANLKRWHGLERAKFRCLWKVDYQTKMAATANNLKKLAGWLKNAPPQALRGQANG